MGFMPKPSRRVKMMIVIAASRDRPNESSNAERLVALMKRPPVLHRMAAPTTRRSGEELMNDPDEDAFSFFIFHLSFLIFHLITTRLMSLNRPALTLRVAL